MSRFALLLIFTLTLLSTLALAAPPQPWYEKYQQRRVIVPQSYYEALSLRRQMPIKPNAVRDMVCLDTTTYVITSAHSTFHFFPITSTQRPQLANMFPSVTPVALFFTTSTPLHWPSAAPLRGRTRRGVKEG